MYYVLMGKFVKLSIVIIELLVIVGLVAVNVSLEPKTPLPQSAVASATYVPTPTPLETLAPLPSQIAQRIEQIDIKKEEPQPPKEEYLIAFLGDSMIETMGGGLPYVYKKLKDKYPKTDFVLYNYGIGAENMVEAISRFGLPYEYKDRKFEPITERKPDIIVLGSYAYNPLTPFDKNESWLLLAELINKAKATGADVYLLAEQAPIREGFATGVGGVNWPPEISDPHVEKIVQGLKNAVGLAPTMEVGLINVFEASKIEGSEYGNPEYVATHDGIHYSEEGQEFSAEAIVEALEFK